MKIQKFIIIFLSVLFLSGCMTEKKQITAEDVFTQLGKKYEVCGRCGNISVNLENETGDIILIHWDSPYVDYQNREGRIKLKHKNLYKDGKTYVDQELFSILGLEVEQN